MHNNLLPDSKYPLTTWFSTQTYNTMGCIIQTDFISVSELKKIIQYVKVIGLWDEVFIDFQKVAVISEPQFSKHTK